MFADSGYIDNARVNAAVYDIRNKLFKTTTGMDCESLVAPLERYIKEKNTPLAFIRAVCYATNTQKTTIARKLAQGGSDAEIIARLKTYLKTSMKKYENVA